MTTNAPVPSRFEFEATTLYDPTKAKRALDEHPALYTNHLAIAERLQQWAKKVDDPGNPQIHGFADALYDVAAHLRQADYLPGSPELRNGG